MKPLCGRRVIYTDVEEITDGNVVSVLQKALAIHLQNRLRLIISTGITREISPFFTEGKRFGLKSITLWLKTGPMRLFPSRSAI